MSRAKKMYRVLLMLCVGVPLAATSVLYIVFSLRVGADARVIAGKRVTRVATQIEMWVAQQQHLVDLAASQIELSYEVQEEQLVLTKLRGMLRSSPQLRSLYYGTVDNRMVNATGWVPPQGWDLRSRPWYMAATMAGRLIVTEPFLNASRDAMIVTVAKPVLSQDKLRGVVGADIELTAISNLIVNTPITAESTSYLVTSQQLIASSLPKGSEANIPEGLLLHLPLGGSGQLPFGNGMLMRDMLIYAPVAGTSWHLAAVIPWRDVFPHAKELWLAFGLTVVGASILAGGFAAFYQYHLAGPLLHLEQEIKDLPVSSDCFDHITIKGKGDAFSSLAATINELLDRTQSYYQEALAGKTELEQMNVRLEEALSEEQETRQELELQQVRWRALFDNSADAIAVTDVAGSITEVNASFERLFGYPLELAIKKNIDKLLAPHRLTEAQGNTANVALRLPIRCESTRLTSTGVEVEVEIKGTPIVVHHDLVGAYAIYSDISKRRTIEREILHLSQHDQLTGLFNRAYFDQKLRELEQAGLIPVSLLMGDINGLKLINDAFGHAAGDELLRRAADAIRSCCGDVDFVARVGGDEFAVIMPGADHKRAEAVRQCIEQMCLTRSEGWMQLSVSFGVSCKSTPSERLSHLLTQAEDHMYRRKLNEGKSARSALIASLMQALEEKTRETTAHSDRMGELSRQLAEKLGLPASELYDIPLLAALHDIGKIGIPEHVLNKPGPLTPAEWEVMKKHSEIGYRIASTTVELAHVAESILHHHERWDGTGYPLGLSGDDIPMIARIISVVDAYDAMTHHRAYRAALTHDEAIKNIELGSGTQFDPRVVRAFLEIMSRQA